MRLPNSYGSVYKLSGKRRRPWAVRKTVGYNESGSAKYAYIGYYHTKSEALTALALYNRRPLDPEGMALTFGECYEKWSAEKFPKLSKSAVTNYSGIYKNMCPSLYFLRVRDIRLEDLQRVVDESGKNISSGKQFKYLCGQVFAWAEKHEVAHDKAQIVKYIDLSGMGNPRARKAARITADEIQMLWDRSEDRSVQLILCLIYSGMRINEMLSMPSDAVHEGFLEVREAKTAAGVREVPIADKIKDFIRPSDRYAFPRNDGDSWTYKTFTTHVFEPYLPGHRVHDTRHTCISLLTEAGTDSRIIKSIVGHQGLDVTEQVYTHISMDAKKKAIDSI